MPTITCAPARPPCAIAQQAVLQVTAVLWQKEESGMSRSRNSEYPVSWVPFQLEKDSHPLPRVSLSLVCLGFWQLWDMVTFSEGFLVFGCKQKNPHHFSACVILNYSGRKGLNSSPFLILSYITCITFLLCYCIFFFASLDHTFKILPFLEKLPKGKKWSKA